jgi:hypothetical protein
LFEFLDYLFKPQKLLKHAVKALLGSLNFLAVFMEKEPTRIGSGSKFIAACHDYTAVIREGNAKPILQNMELRQYNTV